MGNQIVNITVLAYDLGMLRGIEVRLERVKQMDGSDLWAIRKGGLCFNKQGEWEFEPIPSSRTKEFLKRCRWESSDEALTCYLDWLKANSSMIEEKTKGKLMKKAKCKKCGRNFMLGRDGTVTGCDKCTGVTRDKDGYAWEKGELTQTRAPADTADDRSTWYEVTRAEAFEEK